MELEYLPAKKLGYESNKNVKFRCIEKLYINKFRTIKDRDIVLGKNITLITGKNGTMKSTILGLIAHPFSSPNGAVDVFNNQLKTHMKDVFRMSLEKDTERYKYTLNFISSRDERICETVVVYPRKEENRFRVTVGTGNKSGDGNFSLNTAYLNLKRLFPIIETNANIMRNAEFTDNERQWISNAYLKIMTRDAFTEFDCISDYKDKNTVGPKNASYDFNSISSGEDNLGNILMKMLAFVRNKVDEDCLQGIFCIDEIEASMHPVALTNLFDFLLNWSKKNKIQIVATTHSLYLIDHALKYQLTSSYDKKQDVAVNIISTAHVGNDNNYRVINNPTYKEAYKELTLKNPEDDIQYKVNIICEDELAENFIKTILQKKKFKDCVNFITNVADDNENGTNWHGLVSLGKNGHALLEDSIIILDPDVSKNAIQPVVDKGVDILIIPDVFNLNKTSGLAIEKAIPKFIFQLDGADKAFGLEEKNYYLNSLYKSNIYDNGITFIDNIKKYKNWRKDNKRVFNKFLYAYVSANRKIFDSFQQEIMDIVNKKRSKKGMALIN